MVKTTGISPTMSMKIQKLEGNYTGYREFHLRDTPKGQQPTETNDIVVIYKVNNQDLVLVAVNLGSHKKLFHGRYHKKR